MTALPVAAATVHIIFRLWYVIYVGSTLLKRSRTPIGTSVIEATFQYRMFQSCVTALQVLDATSFGLLCAATWSTIKPGCCGWALHIVGSVLVGVGVLSKWWAAKTLGDGSYTWRDFFLRPNGWKRCDTGLYRITKDPMYTLGYLHAYGVALLFLSWPGLVAAAFDQAWILAMARLAEHPHVESMTAGARESC